jgi:hypothetical protein
MRSVYLRLAWVAAFGRDGLLFVARWICWPLFALSSLLDRAALYCESQVRQWP